MLSLFVTLQSFVSSVKGRLSREESGATAVEYGLLVGLIAVAIVGTLILLGPQLQDLFETVLNGVKTANVNAPAA
ncbi:Flp family type IVb pilin [Paramicrobacterium agarici]|uniref:Pilus assembly protein Flp/PilA n=1 Tax=Paramicrobacterium agarici TaxID=630514 RepID=A0A2A9DTS8_9MICO|nr:Flp family type IVb pilin [Microbacterium agarici]PFG29555.1 pilus assembly protein Flp/PilA [Microbacterium agarici]TQO22560.1 pilus assembly protein Flp/PilA [Microbacterium agarici]